MGLGLLLPQRMLVWRAHELLPGGQSVKDVQEVLAKLRDQVMASGRIILIVRLVSLYTWLIGHKIFSGEASVWLVSIAAFGQALSALDSPSAQLAHLLAQAAQVLLSHVFLPLLQANHES